jgi:hypothetical protein
MEKSPVSTRLKPGNGPALPRVTVRSYIGQVRSMELGAYREKAAEMRKQAARAEKPDLRAMYASIAIDWDLKADGIEIDAAVPHPKDQH